MSAITPTQVSHKAWTMFRALNETDLVDHISQKPSFLDKLAKELIDNNLKVSNDDISKLTHSIQKLNLPSLMVERLESAFQKVNMFLAFEGKDCLNFEYLSIDEACESGDEYSAIDMALDICDFQGVKHKHLLLIWLCKHINNSSMYDEDDREGIADLARKLILDSLSSENIKEMDITNHPEGEKMSALSYLVKRKVNIAKLFSEFSEEEQYEIYETCLPYLSLPEEQYGDLDGTTLIMLLSISEFASKWLSLQSLDFLQGDKLIAFTQFLEQWLINSHADHKKEIYNLLIKALDKFSTIQQKDFFNNLGNKTLFTEIRSGYLKEHPDLLPKTLASLEEIKLINQSNELVIELENPSKQELYEATLNPEHSFLSRRNFLIKLGEQCEKRDLTTYDIKTLCLNMQKEQQKLSISSVTLLNQIHAASPFFKTENIKNIKKFKEIQKKIIDSAETTKLATLLKQCMGDQSEKIQGVQFQTEKDQIVYEKYFAAPLYEVLRDTIKDLLKQTSEIDWDESHKFFTQDFNLEKYICGPFLHYQPAIKVQPEKDQEKEAIIDQLKKDYKAHIEKQFHTFLSINPLELETYNWRKRERETDVETSDDERSDDEKISESKMIVSFNG